MLTKTSTSNPSCPPLRYLQIPRFRSGKAGNLTPLYGLLNLWTRPTGGFIRDFVYNKYGVCSCDLTRTVQLSTVQQVPGKSASCSRAESSKVPCALHLDNPHEQRETVPPIAIIILLMVLIAIFNEAGCGANFALVPYCVCIPPLL